MSDRIDLPDAPNIPGLVFRHLRGEADLPALVAIHRGRESDDAVDTQTPEQRTPTVDELADLFLRNPQFNPDAQILIAEVDGQVVGYAWIRSWAEADDLWALYHRELLLPAWRGKGIGEAMMRWAEAVLGAAAAQRPPGIDAHFQSDVLPGERETIARLEAAGYQNRTPYTVMKRHTLNRLPGLTLPKPIVIRPPSPNEYRNAYLTLQHVFISEGMYGDTSEAAFRGLMENEETDPALWRIALSGDEVIGVIICETRELTGLVQEIGVSKAWQRQGIGRALLVSGLHALRERGMKDALVYAEEQAVPLYKSAGFHPIRDIRRYVKPVE